MQKVIKVDNKVTVLLENGDFVEREITDEKFKKILEAQSDDEVLRILCPEYQEVVDSRNKALSMVEKLRQSKLLRVKNDTIYWDNVSSLSIPVELAEAIVDAELEHNDLKISTYRNFWTLMSLNPDEECRKNLYWFLQLHGLKLAKIDINRKMLSEIAIHDPIGFTTIVNKAKKALEKSAA